MSEQPTAATNPNVNVMLGLPTSDVPPRFPCPLCATHLDLRESRSRKPYCVCNACGVQIFFRGKSGISRLRRLLQEYDRLVAASTAFAAPAIAVFDQLEALRAQRRELERRRPLIFTNDDLEHTISAVDRDITRLQTLLGQMSGDTKR